MFLIQRRWLWLLVGIWLVVLQSAAQSHSNKFSLQHENTHCAMCNFGHIQSAGPTTVLQQAVVQQAENIAQPLYQQPALPWSGNLSVRAPPFLFETNLIP